MAWIYLITNDCNPDKVYVGQTAGTIERRFDLHKRQAKSEKCNNGYLQKAMLKYGFEHFHIHPLEECSEADLNEREKYWIAYYDSYNNGYNMTLGGDGCRKYSYEELSQAYLELGTEKAVCEKYGCSPSVVQHACEAHDIVISHDNRWTDEYKQSEAGQCSLKQIAALGKSMKGKKLSPEHREKLSIAKKGKYSGKNSPMYGKKFTQEHKNKLSQSSAWAKAVQCIETGEVYHSACKAAQAVGLKSSAGISKCCIGERQTAKNLHWKFYVENKAVV